MTDTLGILDLPVAVTEPAGDPLREALGSFTQAALRYHCGSAWEPIGGGRNVCQTVSTNDPSDNTFSEAPLPQLAVFRDDRNRKTIMVSDDTGYRETNIVMLWIPQVAVQHHKAKRESFMQAIEAGLSVAFLRGRVPTWIVPGDTDSVSAYKGSHIGNQLGLYRPIQRSDLRFDDHILTIEMMNAEPRKYPGLRIMLTLQEDIYLDPAIGNAVSKIETIVHASGIDWQTING
jgi:hypothetical protein